MNHLKTNKFLYWVLDGTNIGNNKRKVQSTKKTNCHILIGLPLAMYDLSGRTVPLNIFEWLKMSTRFRTSILVPLLPYAALTPTANKPFGSNDLMTFTDKGYVVFILRAEVFNTWYGKPPVRRADLL